MSYQRVGPPSCPYLWGFSLKMCVFLISAIRATGSTNTSFLFVYLELAVELRMQIESTIVVRYYIWLTVQIVYSVVVFLTSCYTISLLCPFFHQALM